LNKKPKHLGAIDSSDHYFSGLIKQDLLNPGFFLKQKDALETMSSKQALNKSTRIKTLPNMSLNGPKSVKSGLNKSIASRKLTKNMKNFQDVKKNMINTQFIMQNMNVKQ
jgi:hypothetical protein